jgi:hypothetical protein
MGLIRKVLGKIDLDPASSHEANRRVGAQSILTSADDGLICPWPTGCSVYLNPPGGKVRGKSCVRLFWRRLMEYRQAGCLKHAIFAMFSIEGLQTTQSDLPCAMDFPICVPSRRVRWVDPARPDASSPSHANAFIYIPGTEDYTDQFMDTFAELGRCKP